MPFTTAAALLERERELAMLREGVDRARAGDGVLLLIEAPAGVGKTVLLREAGSMAERQRIVPLEARASQLEQPFAFGVVRQLLEPVTSKGPARADLFAGGAGPAARLFEPGQRRQDSADVGFEALHSLYWLVVNITDRTPLLIVVDDCHWADQESLRFLAYLAQRIEGLPVTMLLAGRPPESPVTESGSVWGQLSSSSFAVALHPRPLSEAAAVAFARERMGAEAADEFCSACHTATGGNPLFLTELLRALDAAGTVPSAAAADEVQSVGPAAVSRFVLHRLAALGPVATELARAVAVLGDGCDVAIAARVSGLNQDAARPAADDLVRADIFVRDERLGFVHPIVRAALYEDLAPGERQARHAAAAEALALEAASAERVAGHLLLSSPTGDQHRIGTLRWAAADAAHRGAPRAAATYLERALAESHTQHERAEILAELGRCEVATMQFAAAEEHLRTALASGGTLTTRAVAASWLGRCAIVSGGRTARVAADALASLTGELRLADPERSLELGAELLAVTSAFSQLRAGLGSQLDRFRNQARGHPGFEAVARIHAAYERLLQGEPAAGATDEVEHALATGLPPSAQSNAALLALLVLRLGERYELAVQLVEAALKRAREEGHATRQGILHAERAAIALAQGSLHDAQAEADTGLMLVDKSHFIALLLVAVAISVHLERGDLAAADRLARTGETFGIANRAHVSDFLIARGKLRIAQGRLEEGVADLLRCGERREARGQRWPCDWKAHAATAMALLGDKQLAATLAREQLAAARRVAAPGALGMSLRAAAAAIGGDDRLALLREAILVLERSSARLELAHALADLSAELGRSGLRREARDAARRAFKLASQCGATALTQTAMAELYAGPGRRARIELTGPDALTAAEWRVCRQAAAGQTNRELAQALFVTEKTVERHLSSAYAKLGIRSRVQLAAAISQ